MTTYSRIRAAEGPRTIRERVAYALAVHDVYGDTNYTQLLDEELEELHGVLVMAASPLYRQSGLHFGCLYSLMERERAARGWQAPNHTSPHITWREGLVDESWPEWLPMADAALTALMVVPEFAAVLNTDPQTPAQPAPLPDPLPKQPPKPWKK